MLMLGSNYKKFRTTNTKIYANATSSLENQTAYVVTNAIVVRS